MNGVFIIYSSDASFFFFLFFPAFAIPTKKNFFLMSYSSYNSYIFQTNLRVLIGILATHQIISAFNIFLLKKLLHSQIVHVLGNKKNIIIIVAIITMYNRNINCHSMLLQHLAQYKAYFISCRSSIHFFFQKLFIR